MHGFTVSGSICANDLGAMGPFINYVTQKRGGGGGGGVSASVTMYTLSIHQYGIMCDEGRVP